MNENVQRRENRKIHSLIYKFKRHYYMMCSHLHAYLPHGHDNIDMKSMKKKYVAAYTCRQ